MTSSPLREMGLDDLRSTALDHAVSLGAQSAEVRVERIRTQYIALRDGVLESSVDDTELGMGLRVTQDGSLGFAATVDLDADGARGLADTAIDGANRTRRARRTPVVLVPEPSYGDAVWIGEHEIDPTEISLVDKVGLLSQWSERLSKSSVVDHVNISLMAVAEEKQFANLDGTTTYQQRVRVHPQIEIMAVTGDERGFESMRTIAPPVGRGFEYLSGKGWDFESEVDQLPELLAEKLRAPSVQAGNYDLVIDPTNLWLTLHESVGHATELDRALGYEAAYAGTSFATFDQLNKLQYGSPLMQITGDRTTPLGLATIGYDDEGVKAQSFDIVRDGVLVGYQLDRQIAHEAGFARSNGCSFADSPSSIPIQRMANVSLQPASGSGPTTEELIAGVDRGIYIVGDKSWSIDMQRHNFQFTGQRFYRIEKGRLVGQLADVAYQASTTEFWGSLDGLGGTSTYLLCGAMNCGKGQPGQTAAVSHGSPSALFRNVRILNVREESGR